MSKNKKESVLTRKPSKINKPVLKLHCLKEDSILLTNVQTRKIKSRSEVPPTTPNSEYNFESSFRTLPVFPNLHKLEIPFVRDKGVKYCIEYFGKFFKCEDYNANLLQFWFLDIITDCVWYVQDEFRLPAELQKVVLGWFLYFLNLLRSPQQNISRKKFFTIFKEAILIAAEVIDGGCDSVPLPNEVFELMLDEEKSESTPSVSSNSSLAVNQSDLDSPSYIDIITADGPIRYELPKELCTCEDYDLSSIKSLSETDSKLSGNTPIIEPKTDDAEDLDDISFYKPDLDLPSRFLPILSETEEGGKTTELPDNVIEDGEDFEIYEVTDTYEFASGTCTGSEISAVKSSTSSSSKSNEPVGKPSKASAKASDKDILQGLMVQKMWEQRLLDMSDPNKGWIPWKSDLEEAEATVEESSTVEESDDDWIDITLKNKEEEISGFEDRVVLHFGVLWAIIDLIFKYFYESFQFSLVKMAFQATPEIITQKLNLNWYVPKKNRVEFARPKYEKPKKEKEKTVKEKSEKPVPKKPDKKEEGKKPVSKSNQQPPLTAEEKARIEKEKKELAALEEELRRMEENKKYLYPLAEAATKELFESIFENWQRPVSKKK